MKIIVNAEELQIAIKKAEKVIAKKSTMEILKSIKITAKNNEIIVVANNLESEIYIKLCGQIEQEGSIIIPSDNFKLINKLSNKIVIESKEDEVVIFGKRDLTFKSLLAETFPEGRDIDIDNEAFTISANELKDMLKIKIASGNDPIRPVMQSICIQGSLAWSLDGYRAMQYKMEIENQCSNDLIIPLNAINILDSLIDKKDKECLKFSYDDDVTYLQIKGEDYTFKIRLFKGKYFDIANLIPKDFKHIVTVDSKLLKDSIDFAREIDKDVKYPVILNITDNKLDLSRKNSSKIMNEEIECQIESREDLKIGFNIKYLSDAIRTLNKESIKIQLNDPINPIIITDIDNEKEIMLVLPVRIAV